MIFKVFAKRISLAALLSGSFLAVVYACGWYPDESNYLSFMRPELYDKPKTDHLAFDPSSQFYWRSYENDLGYKQNPSSNVPNLFGWMEQIGKGVTVEDVSTVVYSLPFETINDCYTTLQKNKKWAVPDSLKSNGMLTWLMQKKNRDVLGYLVHAKKSEALSVREYNPWDPAPVDTALADACLKEARLGYAKSKSPFLKSRYAFQLVKNAFYGEKYGLCEEHYVNYAMSVQGIDPYLDTRMAAYRAGALYKNGKKDEAAYSFAMLFDKTPNVDLAYQHSLGFIWSEREAPLNNVLAYCGTNKNERSVVYALYGMRDIQPYQTSWMDSCFRYNNKNELLDVLLMREINKAELNYLQVRSQMEMGYYVYDGWTGGPNFPLEESMKQERNSFLQNGVPAELKKLTEFVHRMRQEEALKNKPLWIIADGYLSYICEDYPSARKAFEQAAKSSLREADKNQLLILNLLVDLREKKIALPNFENELAIKLTQLETLAKSGKEGESYQHIFRNVLKSELPAYFMRKQDSLREMLTYHRFENTEDPSSERRLMHFSDCYFSHSGSLLDRYFSQAQLNGLIDFQRNASSPLDRWLLQGNQYDERIVRELQGVKYFRNFEYEKALDILKHQDNLPVVPDIFYMYVNDYQDVGENNMEQTYTTKEVLEQLIDLKKKAPTDALMAYRYASVLYSLSYHGRCHDAWNFYRDYTETEPYYFNSTDGQYTPFEMQYYYADEAYTWFRKAYDKSTDPIVKQNALWMMAKCEQKRCPSDGDRQPYWNPDDANDYVNWCVNKNAWLARFHQQYKGTPFYNKVYEECAYLQLFAAKR